VACDWIIFIPGVMAGCSTKYVHMAVHIFRGMETAAEANARNFYDGSSHFSYIAPCG
jgi:hypothetical protein